MKKANADVRARLFAADIRQWELAERMNIDATTLCKRLRKELSDEDKQCIFKIIDGLAADAE